MIDVYKSNIFSLHFPFLFSKPSCSPNPQPEQCILHNTRELFIYSSPRRCPNISEWLVISETLSSVLSIGEKPRFENRLACCRAFEAGCSFGGGVGWFSVSQRKGKEGAEGQEDVGKLHFENEVVNKRGLSLVSNE